jgi:peptide-methionine (S)-S-oxide reductase
MHAVLVSHECNVRPLRPQRLLEHRRRPSRSGSTSIGIDQLKSSVWRWLLLGNRKVHCERLVVIVSCRVGTSTLLSSALDLAVALSQHQFHLSDFQKLFPGAIKKARVGFMSPLQSPSIKNPTYQQVCTGQSGHVEVLYVELKDAARHFEELCRFFFTFHDPTLKARQGNDVGFQYASWIFCGDDEQFKIARKVKEELQVAIDRRIVTQFLNKTVVTQITKFSDFTEAHAEHQQYLSKNPNGYCNHRIRLRQWNELKKKN